MKTKETTPVMPSPEMRTPKEIVAATAEVAIKKGNREPFALILVGMLAGVIIAFSCIATMSVSFSIDNYGIARLLNGMLFPFGLCIVILMGGELFTGNILMIMGVMEKKIVPSQMFYNWVWVYLGNFLGSIMIVIPYANTYLLSNNSGYLAVTFMKTAAYKSGLSWMDAFVLGIFCNVLVCTAVLLCAGARDAMGKVACGILPVSLFIIVGVEHCVANMTYVPLGIIASQNSELAALAIEKGVDLSNLNVQTFLTQNLIPVTLGNIVGGLMIAMMMWYCNAGKGSVLKKH